MVAVQATKNQIIQGLEWLAITASGGKMFHSCKHSHVATSLVVACAIAFSGVAVAQTWSSPQLVANGNGQAVSTNGSGTSAVIFTPVAGGLQASVQSGGVWGSPIALSAATAAANIAVAPNGDVLAVWVFRTTNTYNPNTAQARFYSGGHWGNTITISANVFGNVSSSGLPSFGFDSHSQATLIWEEITNPNPVTCSLRAEIGNAAGGFGSAQTISNASTCFGWTRLAVNSSGQVVAVEGAAGILSAVVIAISRDASGAWGTPVTVGPTGVYRQRQPKVGLGNEGTAVLVFLIAAPGVRRQTLLQVERPALPESPSTAVATLWQRTGKRRSTPGPTLYTVLLEEPGNPRFRSTPALRLWRLPQEASWRVEPRCQRGWPEAPLGISRRFQIRSW